MINAEWDATDWHILSLLQTHARSTFREIGNTVGLSAPATAERIRKLEEKGVIRGYYADINMQQVGRAIQAFIQLSTPREMSRRVGEKLKQIPEILGCWRTAGPDSFMLHVGVPSIAHLEGLIDYLAQFGQSVTSMVLSTTFIHPTLAALSSEGSWRDPTPN